MNAQEALKHPWIQMFQEDHNNFDSSDKEADGIVLNRLMSFKRPRLIKKEAMKILLRILEEKHTEALKQEFNHLDKNKLGVLDIDTLQEAFQTQGYEVSKEDLQKLISKIKKNCPSST